MYTWAYDKGLWEAALRRQITRAFEQDYPSQAQDLAQMNAWRAEASGALSYLELLT